MVASQHELASKIGVEIMKKGGNAVDAAIAVGLALAVVYPEAGNIGGGGFMLIRKPDGETRAIDYREKAPAAAGRDMYVDKQGNIITGPRSSTVGYRAAGVPGTLAGFGLAFRKYASGRVSWSELVKPARILASDGFELSHRISERIREYKNTLAQFPDSKRIFLNSGKLFNAGDLIRQPDLARTMLRLERGGAREFYTGVTAAMIADDMKANGGLITRDDLRNYQATERVPVRGTYRGNEIISMSPPSSGGTVIIEILNMLEGYDLRELKYNSASRYHRLAEAMRRAFADRSEFMGDPDFVKIPVAGLLSKQYADRRRSTIDLSQASSSVEIRHGAPAGSEPTETTHFTVVDQTGMVVSNTYTINDLFGSRVTARGTGILLNDEMDDFSSRPGTPNMFGLIQGERNAIQPGKKPLSSMTPTIVLRKDGSFWFALGGRGGPHIISAVVQSIINVIDHDMNLQQAIDAPRIHHQWLPDVLLYEPYGMSPDTLSILDRMGHVTRAASNPDRIASATGIMIDEAGTRLGAVDYRSDGAAIGF
jgi:gamma-glutamyltranspeptidase/glutathione hydrolase